MKEGSNFLIVDVGDIFVQGFLFTVRDDQLELVERSRYVRSVDESDMIEAIRNEYRGRYDVIEVIGDRTAWISSALKINSVNGLTIGIIINGNDTYIGSASYGRLLTVRRFDYGISQRLDDTLQLKVDFLKEWIKVARRENDVSQIINQIGNLRLYPGIVHNSIHSQVAMLGLVRCILDQVKQNFIFFEEDSVGFTRGSHRIILSGELMHYISGTGELILAVLDALGLEGVWEILVDTKNTLVSLGYHGLSNVRVETNVFDIPSVGTVLIPTHKYPWGTKLGDMVIDIGLSENQKVILKSGEIVRIPLEKDIKGAIALNVKPSVEIVGYRGLERINAGLLGLLIDVRGRPLPNFTTEDRYQKKYHQWVDTLT